MAEETSPTSPIKRTRETLIKLIQEHSDELASLNAQIDKAAETEDFDTAESLSVRVEKVTSLIHQF